jgi:Rps23 Pro-64 3,4-dihydroxylase Tpa1-like proline 4-hydroxylase
MAAVVKGESMSWWNKFMGNKARGQSEAEEDWAASLSAPPLINLEALAGISQRRADEYLQADPFPHIMLEDFLSPQVVRSLVAEFPAPQDQLAWRKIRAESAAGDLVQYNKLGMPLIEEMPPVIRELLWEMNSGTFLRFLEKLTGIEGLIADPKLRGGGLHQVLPGGVLGVHADFTNHADYHLDRRLNVLVYLNEDWSEEYGGDLELWSPDMSQCVRKIRPLAGRCVIFNTSADSFHGHPRALTCPEGMTRKSIALYYYTNGRQDREVTATQITDWQSLPEVSLPTAE